MILILIHIIIYENSYLTSRGIEIGKTSILLHGQTLRGTKYVPRHDGSGVDLIKIVSNYRKKFVIKINNSIKLVKYISILFSKF